MSVTATAAAADLKDEADVDASHAPGNDNFVLKAEEIQLPFETIELTSRVPGRDVGWGFTLEDANALWMCITEACGSQLIGRDFNRGLNTESADFKSKEEQARSSTLTAKNFELPKVGRLFFWEDFVQTFDSEFGLTRLFNAVPTGVLAKPPRTISRWTLMSINLERCALSLFWDKCRRDGIEPVKNLLATNRIVSLNLCGTSIGSAGVKEVALSSRKTLTSLNLASNKLQSDDIDYIATIINTTASLTHLELSDNSDLFQSKKQPEIRQEQEKEVKDEKEETERFNGLMQAINGSNLTSLNVSDCGLNSAHHIISFGRMLETNTRLLRVGLNDLQASESDPRLCNLRHYEFDSEVAPTLERALTINCTLTSLEISQSCLPMSSLSIRTIAKILRGNRGLTFMNVTTLFDDSNKDLSPIIRAIANNKTRALQSLRINFDRYVRFRSWLSIFPFPSPEKTLGVVVTRKARNSWMDIEFERNQEIQRRLEHNYARVGVLTSFVRANADNPLAVSILPLIPTVMRFAGFKPKPLIFSKAANPVGNKTEPEKRGKRSCRNCFSLF